MKIIQSPTPVLLRKAKKIEKVDKKILAIIKELKKGIDEAVDPKGVGLAAPQIGKSLQLFVVHEDDTEPYQVFINPEIELLTNKAPRKDQALEGCLSLDGIWGKVSRAAKVKVRYMDAQEEQHEEIFEGLMATIIQHEYDHLQGILFSERIDKRDSLYKTTIWRGKTVLKEISNWKTIGFK